MQRRLLFPRPGVTRCCDAGSLHILPATTGAHVLSGIPGGLRFLLLGGIPPHVSDLYWGPPWGLSVLVLSLLCPLGLLYRLFLVVSGRLAISTPASSSSGGGGGVSCPLLPPSPLSASPPPRLRSSVLSLPILWSLGFGPIVMEEPGFGHYVGRPPAFHIPPHVSDLYWGPPWGLSVLVLSLLCPLGLLYRLFLVVSGRLAISTPASSSSGGGGGVSCPLLPPSPLSASPPPRLRSSVLSLPILWSLGFGPIVMEEPGFGHYVGRPPAFQ